MKISLKGLNSIFEEAEDLVNVKISQLKDSSLKSRWEKRMKINEENSRPVGQHQVYQHTLNRSSRKREEKGAEKII